MIVEPGVNLLVLGDFNGRLTSLEPNIRRNDINGNMIEEWSHKYALTHMNTEERCEGVYTFGKPDSRGRSAIDHVLVNQEMYKKCGGLRIDETGEESGMSDHNIVVMEWNIGQDSTHRWRKKEEKEVRT